MTVFQKGNLFGKLNKGRKRPDLAERNRLYWKNEEYRERMRKLFSERKKGKGLVFHPDNPCSRCKSIHVISANKSWKCRDCGHCWVKNPIGNEHLKAYNPDHPCPRCGSIRVGNNKEYFACRNCGKNWVKNPKPKDWRKYIMLGKGKLGGKLEQIQKMSESMSQHQIAEKLRVNQTAISQFMRRNGIKTNPQYIWINRDPNKQLEINQKISKALKGNINWKFSHQYPNNEEKKMIRFFKRWNLPFKYVGDGSFKIDGKCPDFIYEEKRAIIEFFGELWHQESDELKRTDFFKERNWNCLIIWGKELPQSEGRGRISGIKERRLYDRIVRWLAGLEPATFPT